MDLILRPSAVYKNNCHLTISGSKSESNRLLILKALFTQLEIKNLSTSDDTTYLKAALESQDEIIDVGHAGTALRFLTAYFASQPDKEKILTGSKRLQQRPIQPLVQALQSIGAQIEYLERDGYAPIKIYGKNLKNRQVVINATDSSQYVTALMLIAPSLKKGLNIKLQGKITSRPYITMTLNLLTQIGVDATWHQSQAEEEIVITNNHTIKPKMITVESDWSSASYWYSWVALQDAGYSIRLTSFKENSHQGDKKLAVFYEAFGVKTRFKDDSIILTKTTIKTPQELVINLKNQPDLAQTIFATCLGLGINVKLTGLHTLPFKESNRIEAMKTIGLRFLVSSIAEDSLNYAFAKAESQQSPIITTKDSISLKCELPIQYAKNPIEIDTYNDHRMAMAFAPLACKTPLKIKDAGVVTKSYPQFWEDLKSLNVDITEI